MNRRSIARVLGASLALTLMPTAAYAVAVSSGDGKGTQSRTVTYSNGAAVNGTLLSTHSYIYAYYAGLVDWGHWYCENYDIGRYTSNTNSASAVTRGGTISYWPAGACGGGVKVSSKVCRDISYAPDSCGSWSPRY